MLNRMSFYAVSVGLVAVLLAAGCAKQDVVRKDEGLAATPVVKQLEVQKPAAASAGQSTQLPVAAVSQPQVAARQTQQASSIDQLQSALDKIYFNFDSAGISESARETLSKNAAVLVKEPSAKIRIEGNCDERGSAEYNLALGERRAKAAQQYLVSLGVKPERLAIISYGKEKPAVQGSDESAWAKNRRDEFVVVK